MVFGILHNALELRYVVRRYGSAVAGPLLVAVLAMVTVIAFARLAGPLVGARRLEVVLGFGILAAAAVRAARRRPGLAAAALAAIVLAASVAWRNLDFYFVAVAYVHNLVPLFFLWEWAGRRLAGRQRTVFRAAQVGWFVVVPALFLGGAIPVSAGAHAGAVEFAGPVAGHVGAVTPAAWRSGPAAGRFLALFAFLQVLHYAFWCWFFPRRGGLPPRPSAAGARTRWTGRLAVGGVAVLAALFVLGFVASWATTKTAYTSVASYHAYLEFAVLAALLFGTSTTRADARPA